MIDATPQAIPTSYQRRDGTTVRLKSRLEGFIGWLLDLCEIAWVYEPESFLLPNGANYMPDFWCPDIATWVEVRGYDSDLGRRQITGFADLIRGDSLWGEPRGKRWQGVSYLVIGPQQFLYLPGAGNKHDGICDGLLHAYPYLILSACEVCGYPVPVAPMLFLDNDNGSGDLCVGCGDRGLRYSISGPDRNLAACIEFWRGRMMAEFFSWDMEETHDYNEMMERIGTIVAALRRGREERADGG